MDVYFTYLNALIDMCFYMFQKVPVPNEDTKQNEVSSSKTDAAKDVESNGSDEKTIIKDKDKKNDAENDAKTDSKGLNDEPKTTVENTDSKDAKTVKPATNYQNNDNEKLKPTTTEDTKNAKPATNDNSPNEYAKAFKPTTENHDSNKKQVNNNNNNNNDNNDNSNDKNDNSNDKNDNDDDNDANENSSEHKDNNNVNDNSINKTEQQPLKTSDNDENKATDKPELPTDDKTINDKPEDTKSATNTDSVKNEDNQNSKAEDSTKNKDIDRPGLSTTDQPEKKVNEDSKLAPIDNTEDEDINKPKQTTKGNMDNKINEKPQLTTDGNTASENTEKATEIQEIDKNNNKDSKNSAQTTSDNLANDSTDKTKSETNENSDKITNAGDNPDISTPTTDKPGNFPNVNKDNGSPDNGKASDIGSDVKATSKNQQQNVGQHMSVGSKDLPKDNDESSPVNFGNSDSKLKEGALPKSDDVVKDTKNSDEMEGMEKDDPNEKSGEKNNVDDKGDSNGNDDIKSKVEQLSMKTGDESEEEKGTLGITGANNDGLHGITAEEKQGTSGDKTKVSSSGTIDDKGKESIESSEKSESINENDNGSPSQENKSGSQQVQGDTSSSQTGTQSMNKVDVVNTLVGGSSGSEKVRSTSVSELNSQTIGGNINQENLADQNVDKTTQGEIEATSYSQLIVVIAHSTASGNMFEIFKMFIVFVSNIKEFGVDGRCSTKTENDK